MDSSKKSVGKTKIVEDIKKFATKKDKASSSSKSKVYLFIWVFKLQTYNFKTYKFQSYNLKLQNLYLKIIKWKT